MPLMGWGGCGSRCEGNTPANSRDKQRNQLSGGGLPLHNRDRKKKWRRKGGGGESRQYVKERGGMFVKSAEIRVFGSHLQGMGTARRGCRIVIFGGGGGGGGVRGGEGCVMRWRSLALPGGGKNEGGGALIIGCTSAREPP